MRISADYGERLDIGNLQENALQRLLAKYPAHGFVIDKTEAGDIFKSVETPPEDFGELITFFERLGNAFLDGDQTYFYWLADEPPEAAAANDAGNGAKPAPEGEPAEGPGVGPAAARKKGS